MAIVEEKFDRGERNLQDLITQLKEIRRISFSGNLIVQIPSAQNWMLSFSSGYLNRIHGGINPDSRWQRNLEIAHLNLPLDRSSTTIDDTRVDSDINFLAQQSVALEVLFDIIQYTKHNHNQLSYQLIPANTYNLKSSASLPLLEIRMVLSQALVSWQEWSKAGLGDHFPGKFIHLNSSQQLLPLVDDPNLQAILAKITGNKSLRDLAICHRQHIFEFTKSILPLIQTGTISFEIKSQIEKDRLLSAASNLVTASKNTPMASDSQPLVACIDDHLAVYESLEKILSQCGYRSFGVQDPSKIIASLVENKPDLIFLDLIMPMINGYEVCEKIRKISSLKNVPVIILSSRDGSFERERAKVTGANGFLGKPIRPDSVIKILEKYIKMNRKIAEPTVAFML
jgi:two-component system, chemotaxis family, response regulator PixG